MDRAKALGKGFYFSNQMYAMKAMVATVEHLYAHIHPHQLQCSGAPPGSSIHLRSDISWLADYMTACSTNNIDTVSAHESASDNHKERPDSSVKGAELSLGTVGGEGSCQLSQRLAQIQQIGATVEQCSISGGQQTPEDEVASKISTAGSANSVSKGSVAAAIGGIEHLRSSNAGQQSLLRALLHIEALRVLDQGLATCLVPNSAFQL